MINKGYKNNQAVSVINKVQGGDRSLPISADNTPMYMGENPSDSGSCNFGTDRIGQKGRCLLFNTTSRIDVIANNGDISSVSAIDETNAIVSLTPTFVTDRYQITGVDGNKYWNIKCWANGVTPTDEQKRATTLDESVETDLYTWWKCEDATGTTALIKAYLGGVNGIIINPYLGFHAIDVNIPYSYLNEVGYTLSDGMSFYYNSAATQLIPSGVFIPRDESNRTKCIAYTAVGVQADLQYIGKCPSQAEYVESPCFVEGGGAYYALSTPIQISSNDDYSIHFEGVLKASRSLASDNTTSNYLEVFSNGDLALMGAGFSTPVRLIDASQDGGGLYNEQFYIIDIIKDGTGFTTTVVRKGYEDILTAFRPNADTYTITFDRLFQRSTVGSPILAYYFVIAEHWYPLSEPIKDAANHTAFDIVGGNHATLINGSLANEGKQDVFHYGELGFNPNWLKQYDFDWGVVGNEPDNWEPINTACTVLVENTDTDFNGNYMESIKLNTGNSGPISKIFLNNGDSITLRFKYKATGSASWAVRTLEVDTGTEELLIADGAIYTFEKTYIANGADGTRGIIFLSRAAGGGYLRVDDFELTINGVIIPASAALDGTDALGNPLTVTQDGKSFLGTCKLKHVEMARVVQADKTLGSVSRFAFQTFNGGTTALRSQSILDEFQNFEIEFVVQDADLGSTEQIAVLSHRFDNDFGFSISMYNNSVQFSRHNETITALEYDIDSTNQDGRYLLKKYGSTLDLYKGGVFKDTGTILDSGSNPASNIDYSASFNDMDIGLIRGFAYQGDVKLFNIGIKELDASGNYIGDIAFWKLDEEITSSVHTAKDRIGDKDLTLINGDVINSGIVVDSSKFWFDDFGDPIIKSKSDFVGNIGDQIISDISNPNKVTNIRTQAKALNGKQLNTELIITKNI